MSSYEGTWSRSNRDSGAVVDVGEAVFDSKRIVEGTVDCNGASEERRAVNVGRVYRKRSVRAETWAAQQFGLVRGAAVREKARSKGTKERMVVIWVWK